jgi:hypothetical protein
MCGIMKCAARADMVGKSVDVTSPFHSLRPDPRVNECSRL